MKNYFTLTKNELSKSYRRACWDIVHIFECDSGPTDMFDKVTKDIADRFPDLPCSYTAKEYLIRDGIGNRFCTFVLKAEREQIINVMQYVISYAQQHDLVLLTADYLYRPDGTMEYFSKVVESVFPPTEKW